MDFLRQFVSGIAGAAQARNHITLLSHSRRNWECAPDSESSRVQARVIIDRMGLATVEVRHVPPP